MKTGWETRSVAEVTLPIETIDPTKSPSQSFRYVDVSTVSNETLEIGEPQTLFGRDAPSRARRKIRYGDVIFATIRPTLKRIALVPEYLDNQVCSTGYFVFRPRPFLDNRFLFYYLQAGAFLDAMEKLQTGASYPAVNDSQVKAQFIRFPSLAEQRRIVGILDEAFAGLDAMRANAEGNVANASELFEAELESVLNNTSPGWRQTRIGDIADTQYGLSLPMNTEGTGFKIFRMGEVQNGRLIDTGRMKHVDISQNEFSAYKLKPGDVLFNRTNSYELVGKTGIFDLEGDYCFASYLIRLIVRDQRIDTRLLNYIMNTSRFQEQVKRKAAKSVNQANINATILSNEIIKFPIDRSEQLSIVERFDAFKEISENLENSYRSKLRMVDELKKSLLHQAFSGNL